MAIRVHSRLQFIQPFIRLISRIEPTNRYLFESDSFCH